MVSVGIKCCPISDKKSSKLRTARGGELQDTSAAVSGRHLLDMNPLRACHQAQRIKVVIVHMIAENTAI